MPKNIKNLTLPNLSKFNPYGSQHQVFIPLELVRSNISDSGLRLLGLLFRFAGKDGIAYPSRKRLAYELNWNIRKLDRVIKYLKEEQLLETCQENEHSSSYYIFIYNHKYYEHDKKAYKYIPENTKEIAQSAITRHNTGGTDKNDSRGTDKNDKRNRVSKEESQKRNNVSSSKKSPPAKSSAKKNGKKPAKILKELEEFKGFGYSASTKRILRVWKQCGGKVHKQKGCKGALDIDKMISDLLTEGKTNPYSWIVDPDRHGVNSVDRKWTVKEIIRCIRYYTKTLGKRIDAWYLSSFIYLRTSPNSPQKDYSPLANCLPDLPNKISTKLAKKLKEKLAKKIEKSYSSLDVNSAHETSYVKAASHIERIEKDYERHSGSYFGNTVMSLFIEYIIEKANNQNWKLDYIAGDTFADEFLSTMLKRYSLQKIEEKKKAPFLRKVN